MKFDDETMRRILNATFGAVEADVAVEAELGPLVHVGTDGRRIHTKQDGDTGVITLSGAGRGDLVHEYVGVDLDALT
jgi:hypothetical protein